MKLLIISLFAILTQSCTESNRVEFKPIFQVDEKLVEQEPTNNFYPHLEQVLKYYSIEHSINEKGIILVDEELSKDKDLCWNYTTKANDSIWLMEH